MTDFCWPILLAGEIGELYHLSDIRFSITDREKTAIFSQQWVMLPSLLVLAH